MVDNPVSWGILTCIVFTVFFTFLGKVADEVARRKADCEASWAEIVSENNEDNWWDFH